MCGRYTSRTPVADVAGWFDVDEVVVEERTPRFNVAPTDDVLVVATSSSGARRLGEARWGLVPSWSEGPSVGARMINARSETLLEKPAFRRAFARRRCLVPADGFYEWEHDGAGGGKQPWYLTPADGGLFAFAGLWEVWRPDDDPARRLVSCTIVTTPANAAVAPLHDRMPAVLGRDTWVAWLDRDNEDLGALHALLVPAPDDAVRLRRVSRAVNDVRNDGPALLDPPGERTLLG
jgi:putative SOS response-associated peptidase YedK